VTQPTARPPESHRLIQNTVVNAVAQVLAIFIGLLLLPFMLSRMGPELYGLVLTAQIFSITGVLAYADAGLASAATRYMASAYAEGKMDDVRRVLTTTVAAFLTLGTILGLGVYAFTELFFFRFFPVPAERVHDMRLSLYLYAATLALHFSMLAIKALYMAVHDQLTLKIWDTLGRVVYAGAIVAVLLLNTSVFAVVAAEQVVAIGIGLAFVALAWRKYGDAFSLDLRRASMETFRRIGGFGAHVFANYFATYGVFQRAPDIFISHYLGPESLTYYSIISRIPRIIKTLTAAANAAATPFAAALDGLELREKLGRLVLRGARYSYLILTPTVLFVLVFAEQILSLWMGSQYAGLANLMRAFVVWQYVMFFVLYTNATITKTKQYARLLPYALGANVTFLALMWLTIERYGLWSVLGAQLVSMLVLATGALVVQRRTHQFGMGELFDEVVKLPMLVGGGVALAAFSLLKVSLAPRAAIPLLLALGIINAVYMLLVYRFGLGTSERDQLLRLVRKAARR
jgi:O-antigen/teichoic acid export membrane protein